MIMNDEAGGSGRKWWCHILRYCAGI